MYHLFCLFNHKTLLLHINEGLFNHINSCLRKREHLVFGGLVFVPLVQVQQRHEFKSDTEIEPF